VPGNVDATLFFTGFAVGAASIVMFGVSMLEDHPRRIVLPATIAGALLSGGILGWSLNYFFHWAQKGP
jgi:membrane protein YqaA with SNARE-associated domain